MQKWLRPNEYKDPFENEWIHHDPVWFDVLKELISCPANEWNRVHLTWEVVQLSRINTFHSLHTLHYDNAAFLNIVEDAYRKYPYSFEFRIAFAFVGVASGHYHNGFIKMWSKLVKTTDVVFCRNIGQIVSIANDSSMSQSVLCLYRSVTF